jgi:hypothetical protein
MNKGRSLIKVITIKITIIATFVFWQLKDSLFTIKKKNIIESNLRQFDISHSLKFENELDAILRLGHLELV